MVEPLIIFIPPIRNADELKALADTFPEVVTRTLEPDIPVVNQRGEVRAAITNVKVVRKKRGLLGYTPIGLVVRAVKDAAGPSVSLKDAVLEIEMLDSTTLGQVEEPVPLLIMRRARTAAVTTTTCAASWESDDDLNYSPYASYRLRSVDAGRYAPLNVRYGRVRDGRTTVLEFSLLAESTYWATLPHCSHWMASVIFQRLLWGILAQPSLPAKNCLSLKLKKWLLYAVKRAVKVGTYPAFMRAG